MQRKCEVIIMERHFRRFGNEYLLRLWKLLLIILFRWLWVLVKLHPERFFIRVCKNRSFHLMMLLLFVDIVVINILCLLYCLLGVLMVVSLMFQRAKIASTLWCYERWLSAVLIAYILWWILCLLLLLLPIKIIILRIIWLHLRCLKLHLLWWGLGIIVVIHGWRRS